MSTVTIETTISHRSLMHKAKDDLAELVLVYADLNGKLYAEIERLQSELDELRGTSAERFHWLIKRLQERLAPVNPADSAKSPEQYLVEAVDALKAELAAQTARTAEYFALIEYLHATESGYLSNTSEAKCLAVIADPDTAAQSLLADRGRLIALVEHRVHVPTRCTLPDSQNEWCILIGASIHAFSTWQEAIDAAIAQEKQL